MVDEINLHKYTRLLDYETIKLQCCLVCFISILPHFQKKWFVSFETIITVEGDYLWFKTYFNNWLFEVRVILFIEFHRVTTITFWILNFLIIYQFEHYLCFKGIKLLLVTFNIIIIIKIWKKNKIVKALGKRNAFIVVYLC